MTPCTKAAAYCRANGRSVLGAVSSNDAPCAVAARIPTCCTTLHCCPVVCLDKGLADPRTGLLPRCCIAMNLCTGSYMFVWRMLLATLFSRTLFSKCTAAALLTNARAVAIADKVHMADACESCSCRCRPSIACSSSGSSLSLVLVVLLFVCM